MSRIGKQPIALPGGVEVAVGGDNVVTVKGPRGSLTQTMHANMRIVVEDGTARVERPDDEGFNRSLHGLTRSLLANMVVGVTDGFEKRLAIVGVGYRAALKGKDLEVQVGYSHPVLVEQPDGIEFEVPTPTRPAPSPTTTSAANENLRPPRTTFATRLIEMTRSSYGLLSSFLAS